MSLQPDNIFAGTQVVSLVEVRGTNNSLAWRKELRRGFERALAETELPERPNYEAAYRFLVKARREMANSQTWMDGGTDLDHTPPSSAVT